MIHLKKQEAHAPRTEPNALLQQEREPPQTSLFN